MPPGSPARTGRAGLVLVTREGCHLCAQAEGLLRALSTRRGEELTILDVDRDLAPDLREHFTELVPVVEVEGVEVGRWRIDIAAVERALDARS